VEDEVSVLSSLCQNRLPHGRGSVTR